MKRQFIFNMTRLLALSGLIFLAACSSTPDKETSTRAQNSQDILFSKAKTAYLSRNYKIASAMFSNLAEQGHADAQYSLGYMYYYGTGVPKNLNEAMHWFTQSAAQGNNNAATALATIQKMISDSKQPQNPATSNQTPAFTPQSQNNSQTAVIDLRQHKEVKPYKPRPVVTPPAANEYARSIVNEPTVNTPVVTQPKSVVVEPDPIITQPKSSVVQPEAVTQPESVITQTETNKSNQTNQTATLTAPSIKQSAREIQYSQWILKQPSSYYTIQLASSTSRTKTMKFIRQVELDGVYFFRTTVNGVERYTIIHGSFPQYGTAKAKLSLLKKRGYKNIWIRGMRGIKTAIERQ